MNEDYIIRRMLRRHVARQISGMLKGNTKRNKPVLRTLSANEAISVFVVVNGQQAGPFSENDLIVLVKKGVVTSNTLVWTPNLTQWTTAANVPLVYKLLLLYSMEITSDKRQEKKQASNDEGDDVKSDVLAALAKLGYGNAKYKDAINQMLLENPSMTASDILKNILKKV